MLSCIHQSSKDSRYVDGADDVLKNKGVNETHHHSPKLKASQDTLVIKSCIRWVLCGSTVACLQKEVNISYITRCNVRERVRFIWASNTARVVMLYSTNL